MPKKSAEEMIEELALSIGRGFQEVTERLDATNQRLDATNARLDRIEFLVTGQDRRISILEDKVRQIGTKIGLQFS